jgi:MinD-like ATPase involved in chromosome partitioning or flagellar assembly
VVLLTDTKEGVFTLSAPHGSAEAPETPSSVDKYAGCSHICSAVRRCGSDALGAGNGDTAKDLGVGVAVVSLLGVEGGAGTSSIALGLAGELAAYRGKKVVVLSFEAFESPLLGAGARMSGGQDVSDFLFGFLRTGGKGQECAPAAPYLWRDDHGVIRFLPSAGTNRLRELSGTARERFVEAVAAEVRPDVILLDMGSCADADARAWLRASAYAVLVGRHAGVKSSTDEGATLRRIAEELGVDAERAIHVTSRRPVDSEEDLPDGFTAVYEDPYAFERDGNHVGISLATAFGTGVKELADRVLARDTPGREDPAQDAWLAATSEQEEEQDVDLAA